MIKGKKKTVIITAVIAAVVIALGAFLFDFLKFYKLATFSESEIDNVCKTMSQISDGEIEKRAFPDDDKYVLCFVNGGDEYALFVMEKVYYHNIRSTERYSVKYENTETENEVSSLSFDIGETEQAVIYFWNNDTPIDKAEYDLEETATGKASKKSIDGIQDNYISIVYPYDDFSIEGIEFYSNNSVVYSEKRAEGRQGGLIED